MKEKDRPETVEEFYKQRFNLVSGNLKDELGHFNVFDIVEHLSPKHNNSTYRRRDFYKIKLLTGHYRYHFADKTIEINGTGLFFVNPYIPYQFELIDEVITGFMCILQKSSLINSVILKTIRYIDREEIRLLRLILMGWMALNKFISICRMKSSPSMHINMMY